MAGVRAAGIGAEGQAAREGGRTCRAGTTAADAQHRRAQRDRDAAYAYYRDEIAAGRCPQPLVRKNNACAAPAAGKQVWKLDQPLPEGVTGEPLPAALIGKLSPSRAGYQYLRVDNDILIVGVGTRSVAALVADLSRL